MLFSCLFQCFEEKEYQKESKRNETFGSVIFGKIMIQETWSASRGSIEEATRQGGAPTPWAHPHPRGPLMAPLTDFFRLYKSMYPKNIKDEDRSGVPPPQASVATKNLSGARSDTLSEGVGDGDDGGDDGGVRRLQRIFNL